MVASYSWLLLTAPAAVVAIVPLRWTIASLVRTVRRSVVAPLPVCAEQRMTIDRPGELALNSAESSSLSRSRLELYALTLPTAGSYSLRIDGIDPFSDYSATAVVIARSYVAALVLHVLALILLGATLVGSIVFSALLLAGKIG
jgi:hypothetical protein